MNRRDFMKVFGATAVTASASKVLAGIPDAIPQIALLEPKTIITKPDEDIWAIQYVLHYRKLFDKNASVSWDLGGASLIDGQHVTTIEAEIYMETVDGEIAYDTVNFMPLAERVTFPTMEDLNGEIYQITKKETQVQNGNFVISIIEGYLINSDGSLLISG